MGPFHLQADGKIYTVYGADLGRCRESQSAFSAALRKLESSSAVDDEQIFMAVVFAACSSSPDVEHEGIIAASREALERTVEEQGHLPVHTS